MLLRRLPGLAAWVGTPGLRAAGGQLHQVASFGFGSHVCDNDPAVIEKEKRRHLKGKTKSAIPDAPGWSEKLASDSEAAVKSERSADCSINELQERTAHDFEASRQQPSESESDVGEEEAGAAGGVAQSPQ